MKYRTFFADALLDLNAQFFSFLSDDNNYFWTVFAPVNSAFEALGPITNASLFNNPNTALGFVLDQEAALMQIFNVYLLSQYLVDRTALKTEAGFAVPITVVDNNTYTGKVAPTIYVGTARIIALDDLSTNGVLHKVDTFFMQPNLDLSQVIRRNPLLTTFSMVDFPAAIFSAIFV